MIQGWQSPASQDGRRRQQPATAFSHGGVSSMTKRRIAQPFNPKLAELLNEMDRRRESLAAVVKRYESKNDELAAAQHARGDDKIASEALERLYQRVADGRRR